MRRTISLFATAALALSLAGSALAAGADAGPPYTPDPAMHGCRDVKHNLVAKAKCDAPAGKKMPTCNPKKSKPCGMSCIALDKECHIK